MEKEKDSNKITSEVQSASSKYSPNRAVNSSENVNAQDTFVTLQTKDGHSSHKIPLFQFLEKVVGVKIDKDLQLNVSNILCSDSKSERQDNGNESSKSTTTPEAKTTTSKEQAIDAEEEAEREAENVSRNLMVQESVKPRGRGRPRKVKTQEGRKGENSSIKPTPNSQSEEAVDCKDHDASLPCSAKTETPTVGATQYPRRSRRTPARNLRFKEDFVDSSTLWSKNATSSWNTQLMTLALAAERHDTKPTDKDSHPHSDEEHHEQIKSSKQLSNVSRKRNASFNEASSVACKVQKSVSDAVEPEDLTDVNDATDDVNTKDQVEEILEETEHDSIDSSADGIKRDTLDADQETSIKVLKRPLKEALSFAFETTQNSLSNKTPTCIADKGDNCNATYYAVMEPRSGVAGQGLLVQKNQDGISFNTANVSGNLPYLKSNPLPYSFPQDRFFACDSCESVFTSAGTWLSHISNDHNTTMEYLERSNMLCKEIHHCQLCGDKFPFEFMLAIHIEKKHHENQITNYECDLCQRNFPSNKERDEHCLLAHPVHDCSLCGKLFDNVIGLRRHLKVNCAVGTLSPEHHSEANEHGAIDAASNEHKDQMENTYLGMQATEGVGEDKSSFGLTSCQVVNKIPCDSCDLKFSTYSGLWHHKLEIHQQYFPPGFKDKLLERLEKNNSLLKSTLAFEAKDDTVKEISSRSRYYVVMQPKWLKSRSRLNVSMVDKEFEFFTTDEKTVVEMEQGDVNMLGKTETDSLPSIEVSQCWNGQNGDVMKSMHKLTQFECKHCRESFQSAARYRDHCSSVHNECFEIVRFLGAFQCSQCTDTFPYQFMLDEHVKWHDGKKPLPCTLCDVSFHRIQDRREHWKKVHPGVGCPNCGKMYASIKYLHKHIALNCQDHHHQASSSKRFTASKEKTQGEDLDLEKAEKKVEKKILKCHLCPKICSSIHCWRRHMSENHENDGFSKLSNSCFICDKAIYGYKALEKHLLQEHAEESGLPIDEENSIVKEALKRSKMGIFDYKEAGRDNGSVVQDEEGLYHCPECPKTHPDLKAMMIHLKTHVNMQLECSICNKTFKNPTLLRQHVMRHRTKAVYCCNTCGKKFITLQKLNKHNKVHHTKENFVCELCGMSFALNDYLLKHKKCHTDKRPHSCSVCGKSFRTKPELRVHVLIHTQETPYVCEHCGRGFTQKGNWRIHLAQHTGHKPHKCDQCELSFALPSHLKRHLLTHNQKVNYRCIWCDKECTQRKHMQMHVVRVHKEDFFHYEEQMKLENPVPIAPSQMKMYNRRMGKAGQVRKAYRSRAKKCGTSSQDIMEGVTKSEIVLDDGSHEHDPDSEHIAMETIISEPLGEAMGVGTEHLSLAPGQGLASDGSGLQILVSNGGDHQSYVKHDAASVVSAAGELIGLGDDVSSNVEIVMGENNEINIIINNNGDHHALNAGDLTAVQEALEEHRVASGSVGGAALAHHFSVSDPSAATQLQVHGSLQGSLQQAVSAMVTGSKGGGIVGEEAMALELESLAHGNDTYAIVYPS